MRAARASGGRQAQGGAHRHQRISESAARSCPRCSTAAPVDVPRADRDDRRSSRCRSIRLAEPFEALRDASDAMLAKTGARPKVFLATLGKPSDFTARATFAKNFFEAGGIEAVDSDGYQDRRTTWSPRSRRPARNSPACARRTRSMSRGGRCRQGADDSRRDVHLAGRPGDHEAALTAGRRRNLHLCGLRRARDLAGGA